MMGRAHALSGGAAWLITAPVLAHTANTVSWLPDLSLSLPTYVLGAVAATGAALAPDLDHGERSFARGSLGPVTKTLSKVMGTCGHRSLTHSWLGIIAAIAALVVLGSVSGVVGVVYPAVIMFLVTAFALAALYSNYDRDKTARFLIRAGIAAGVTAAGVYFSDGDYGWLVLAYALGLIIHCLGDSITVQGVPWLWPKRYEYRMSPAIFLALYAVPVVIVVYSMAPTLGLFTGVAAGVAALVMLRPFNAGAWQESTVLVPVFVATALVAVVSVAVTFAFAGAASVGGYPVAARPTAEQSVNPAGVVAPARDALEQRAGSDSGQGEKKSKRPGKKNKKDG
jgi:membrane-bound metal-dependent hydrolase YbcI (DUF457 family)